MTKHTSASTARAVEHSEQQRGAGRPLIERSMMTVDPTGVAEEAAISAGDLSMQSVQYAEEDAQLFDEPGKWKILSNGRIGCAMEPQMTEVGLKQVYRGTDYASLMCRHGETARSIYHRRKIAGAKQETLKLDGSCDCDNTLLLCRGKKETATTRPAEWSPPTSVYKLLGDMNAKEIDFGRGRIGRRMLCNKIAIEMYALPNDMFRCAHGNSESTLQTARLGIRKPKNACVCMSNAHALGAMRTKYIRMAHG